MDLERKTMKKDIVVIEKEKNIIYDNYDLSDNYDFTKEDLMNCGEHLFNAAYNAGAADNVSLILIDYWGRKGGEG